MSARRLRLTSAPRFALWRCTFWRGAYTNVFHNPAHWRECLVEADSAAEAMATLAWHYGTPLAFAEYMGPAL